MKAPPPLSRLNHVPAGTECCCLRPPFGLAAKDTQKGSIPPPPVGKAAVTYDHPLAPKKLKHRATKPAAQVGEGGEGAPPPEIPLGGGGDSQVQKLLDGPKGDHQKIRSPFNIKNWLFGARPKAERRIYRRFLSHSDKFGVVLDPFGNFFDIFFLNTEPPPVRSKTIPSHKHACFCERGFTSACLTKKSAQMNNY